MKEKEQLTHAQSSCKGVLSACLILPFFLQLLVCPGSWHSLCIYLSVYLLVSLSSEKFMYEYETLTKHEAFSKSNTHSLSSSASQFHLLFLKTTESA